MHFEDENRTSFLGTSNKYIRLWGLWLKWFLTEWCNSIFEKRIASTYVLEDNGQIIAYFSLLNDKVSKLDATGSSWKRLKKLFPRSKHFSSYPAIKIGRLAVDKKYEGKGVGRKLMNRIKEDLRETSKASAFRFLTVDAYLSAVPFYEKNGFKMLLNNDENKHTRAMYFDMLEL